MGACSHFTPGLEPTLTAVARIGETLQDDWWVIGSAAIALTGVEIEVPDVDLLVSERDAATLLAGWASPRLSAVPQDRFRSVSGVHTGTPIPVEIMGRLEVVMDDEWVPVAPTTRVAIDIEGLPGSEVPGSLRDPEVPEVPGSLRAPEVPGSLRDPGLRDPGVRVYIPDADDLLALLLMFRRPQDLVRAEMLLRRP